MMLWASWVSRFVLVEMFEDTHTQKSNEIEEKERSEQVNVHGISQRLMLERRDLDDRVAETRREFGKVARRKLVLEDEWKKLQVS